MSKRSSALFRRTQRYQDRNRGSGLLGAGMAMAFAIVPLGVMLWVVPVTGIGIA